MLLPALASGSGAGSAPTDLSHGCVYLRSNGSGSAGRVLSDSDYSTAVSLSENSWASVAWGELPVDFVYFEWTGVGASVPPPYTVELLGAAE